MVSNLNNPFDCAGFPVTEYIIFYTKMKVPACLEYKLQLLHFFTNYNCRPTRNPIWRSADPYPEHMTEFVSFIYGDN